MSGFDWNWQFALDTLPALLKGLRFTLEATFFGSLIAYELGLLWAVARLSEVPVASQAVRLLVEFLRGTPLLIQLYFLFYIFPTYGVTLPALQTGILGLGLYYSAYASEVYRAGIESVPRGQWEAALALGLPLSRMWGRIVVPQAMRFATPVLGNFVISMFKESAILSTITVLEVIGQANILGAETARYIEPFTMAGLLFLAISYPAARLVRLMEARLSAA
jgi:polar amino acid transport system permease protein